MLCCIVCLSTLILNTIIKKSHIVNIFLVNLKQSQSRSGNIWTSLHILAMHTEIAHNVYIRDVIPLSQNKILTAIKFNIYF